MTQTNSDLGLGIYTAPEPSARISVGGANTNPLLIVMDGVIGGVVEKLLYVGSNDEVHAYLGPNANTEANPDDSKVRIEIVDPDGYADGTQLGYSWKILNGIDRPDEITWSEAKRWINLDHNFYNLFNNKDGGRWIYQPFWLRIEIPLLAPAKMVTSVQFRISATRMPADWIND